MSDAVQLMIIDEEVLQLRALKRLFRHHFPRLEVSCFESANSALAAASTILPDIVMCDKRLSDMDGADVLQKIRSQLPKAIRVIYCADMTSESVLASAGVAHLMLNKFTESDQLLGIVRRANCLVNFPVDAQAKIYLGQIDNLPVLPETYNKLQAYLSEEEYPNTKKVGNIISEDVAIFAKIMQIANSHLFGRLRDINTASEAVTRLGYDFVKNLVLSVGLFQNYDLDSYKHQRLMQESEAVSELMVSMMSYLKYPREQVDHAYLAGRLHNVGHLIPSTEALEVANDAALKGAYLLKLWGFKQDIVTAVLHQSDLSQAETESTLTVCLNLAIVLRESQRRRVDISDPSLGFDVSRIEALGLNPWLATQV